MNKLARIAVAAGIALLGSWRAGTNARADVVIDSFEDRPSGFPISAGGGIGTLWFNVDYPHVVGGRGFNLGAGVAGAPDPGSLTVDITSASGVSFLTYSSAPKDAGFFQLTYGGAGGVGPEGGSPMGLSVDPATDYLQLTFLTYNHANGQDMVISANYWGTNSVVKLTSAGPQELDIPLIGFPQGESLNGVNFNFYAPAGTEFELSAVALATIAPEPSSLLLLSICGTALLGRRVRR